MKYILFLILFLSGCASTNLKPSAGNNIVSVGVTEEQFKKQYESIGEKLQYSDIDNSSFAWILNQDKETIWLTGNAFFGGTYTTRHHMMFVQFTENKVSKVTTSYVDGNNKKIMPANTYKNMFTLGDSLSSCKSYLSNDKRGQYGYVFSEMINSWIFVPEVFDAIGSYNKDHGSFLTLKTESDCNDAFALIERASMQVTKNQNEKNKPVININNTNQIENVVNNWFRKY